MLAFTFSPSFVFGVYVGYCILSFLLRKNGNKIPEIDLIIKNYESTDFGQLLDSEKKKNKKET